MPIRRFVLRSLTVIISGLFALGIAEGLARYFYVSPWYADLLESASINARLERRAQLGSKEYGVHRIRDQRRDWTAPKPRDERRILVLGDSFTYGSGVADDAAVFPSLLEQHLNKDLRRSEVHHVDVLNGGMPGSLTGHWLDLWNTVSDQYQPDVLLIVFFLRDGTLTGAGGEFVTRIRDEIVVRNQRSFLYEHSYLFRTIRDGLDRERIGEEYTEGYVQGYFGNETETAEWRRAQANLLDLQERARAKSIPVGFVIFPVLIELNDSYPFRAICDLLEEFARRHGFAVHNLLPDFMGKDATTLWVSTRNQHPNERGHQIAADSMLPFVKGLLDSRDSAR